MTSTTPNPPDPLTGLSIVMVCRNDAATVASAVARAARVAARTSHEYEIVVVDDASSDATAAVVAGLVRPGGPLRALLGPHSHGSGAAERSGVAGCLMPWVLLMDASDELELDALEDFVALAPHHDLITGWRVMRRGPVAVRANSAAWNWLVRQTFGLAVRDVDCPLKLVRRELFERLELRSAGGDFGAELVARAYSRSARVASVHVRQRAELPSAGKSGVSPPLGAEAFLRLVRIHQRLSSDGTDARVFAGAAPAL